MRVRRETWEPYGLSGIGLFREQVGMAQVQPSFVSRLALRSFLCFLLGTVVLACNGCFLADFPSSLCVDERAKGSGSLNRPAPQFGIRSA